MYSNTQTSTPSKGKYISKRTKWVPIDAWRGYLKPINAVGGANNTGDYYDSPCPSSLCHEEIAAFRKKLRAEKIPNQQMVCRSSNVFMIKYYVLTDPSHRDRALEIAKDHQKETSLFYAC